MAKPDSPTTILRRTKRVLKERGWIKGSLQYGYKGPVCLVGAMRIAAYGDVYAEERDSVNLKSYKEARDAIVSCVGDVIPAFNDYKAKSEKDVQEALNCAIKKLSEK
jgi:hypothetical protein